jgi:hypothetical protein
MICDDHASDVAPLVIDDSRYSTIVATGKITHASQRARAGSHHSCPADDVRKAATHRWWTTVFRNAARRGRKSPL